jgi:hypothetical protein
MVELLKFMGVRLEKDSWLFRWWYKFMVGNVKWY